MSATDLQHFHALGRLLVNQHVETAHATWMDLLSRIGPFPLERLPVEIQLDILKMATTKYSTYAALMSTSHEMAALARLECVPELLVLSTRASAMSFLQCITVHPGVGERIRQLWFFPGITSQEAHTAGATIIRTCSGLERLACFPDVVITMCASETFEHTSLVDLTLVDPIMPWERLMGARHGMKLFKQLLSLRLAGGTAPLPPPHGRAFPNLTDITVAGKSMACVQPYLPDKVRFPKLARVVVTIPYMEWRHLGMNFLMSEPELEDVRLCVVHCPKRWKELEIWKDGVLKIWETGVNEWDTRSG
ncbi:hypothetical protein C8J57DRAFT_151964 [Mycena rebaudengoi]|nr:hypothetical protein C8J57DRAFT_151964 [Mycena rebaudengoi]